MITPDAAGSAMLEEALKAANYDCVVIGGGMPGGTPPKGLVLFGAVVNIIHKAAPNATIAFNTRPEDTADAAARRARRPDGARRREARTFPPSRLTCASAQSRLMEAIFMFDGREFLGAAVVGARVTPAFAANKRQVSPSERHSMGKPPSGYSTAVAVPSRLTSSSARRR